MIISLRIRDFIQKSFVRDVGILQISKFISVFLSIAGSIIFARFLGPDLFGKYGLVFAFVALANIFTNWGANSSAITLLVQSYAKRDKKEINNILAYFIKTTLLAMPVGMVIIIFAPFFTSLLYNDHQIGIWSRIILISGFLAIIYNLLIVILQSARKIKQLATVELSHKFTYIISSIIFVMFGWGILGIVFGHFLTALVFLFIGIFIYLRLVRYNQFFPSIKNVINKVRKIRIWKYFKFGFLIALQKNLGCFSSLLPVMFLGIFTLPQDVGYFKVALSYITIPTMILEPISRLLNVQLPRSKVYSWNIFRKHFIRVTVVSIFITVCLTALLVILAPYLVKLLYGSEYIFSIKLVYFMIILPIFSSLSVGFGPFYRTLNRVKISIFIDVFSIILRIVLFLTLMKFYAPIVAIVLGIIITNALSLVIHFFIIKYISKKYE